MGGLTRLNNFLFYLERYSSEILLSMPYFMTVSIFGVFLLLKRSSLFGAVLSQSAQISFLIGTALYFHGHGNAFDLINNSSSEQFTQELLNLDMYVLPITMVILLPYFWISRRPLINSESSLLILFIFLTGSLPLLNKLLGGSDASLLKLYFTEILYTPPEVFKFYLFHITFLTVVLLISHRFFLLSGYDPVQSKLNGMKPGLHSALFFFLTAILLSATIRVLGIYVTLGAMFAPGMAALRLGRSIRGTLVWAACLSVVMATLGFFTAFIFDSLPSEPIILIVIVIGCFLMRFFSSFTKRSVA